MFVTLWGDHFVACLAILLAVVAVSLELIKRYIQEQETPVYYVCSVTSPP
ncbi:hypothetical protein [Helicobacter suis]